MVNRIEVLDGNGSDENDRGQAKKVRMLTPFHDKGGSMVPVDAWVDSGMRPTTLW